MYHAKFNFCEIQLVSVRVKVQKIKYSLEGYRVQLSFDQMIDI